MTQDPADALVTWLANTFRALLFRTASRSFPVSG